MARFTGIVRVRTGCLTCRRRKKKCDEQKPRCKGCSRNDLDCSWPIYASSRRVESSQRSQNAGHRASNNVEIDITAPKQHQIATYTAEFSDLFASALADNEESSNVRVQSRSSSTESSPACHGCQNKKLNNLPKEITDYACPNDDDEYLGLGAEVVVQQESPSLRLLESSLTKSVSLLSDCAHGESELLSYYLSRTAISMGNGSTDVNPFVAELIPLAFSNKLILHLLLAQSAAHREVLREGLMSHTAYFHYNRSIRAFRQSVGNHINGNEINSLLLAVGSLTMCYTEIARGDVHGIVFHHLAATNSVLVDFISDSDLGIASSLRDFITENYTYTAALSMISLDPHHGRQTIFNPNIRHAANELVSKNYIGHLSGCWLPLLLIIPQVYELGSRIIKSRNVCSAEDIITFSSLQNQILSFVPSPTVRSDIALVGYIFQQAVHLYLLTSLNMPSSRGHGMYTSLIDNTITQTLDFLDQIPATARINTSTCWPLAVLGSCVCTENVQNIIRTRLQLMFHTIGLGNMKETLSLLEYMWLKPAEDRGPWMIGKVMQERQICISFA